MEANEDLIQNDKAGRSGLKELGGGIGNGPDQSLRLTAPPAVLYPGRGAMRLPPCPAEARRSTTVQAHVLPLRAPKEVLPAIVAQVEIPMVNLSQL